VADAEESVDLFSRLEMQIIMLTNTNQAVAINDKHSIISKSTGGK